MGELKNQALPAFVWRFPERKEASPHRVGGTGGGGGNGLQSRGESLRTPCAAVVDVREEQVYCPVGLHGTKRPDPVLPSL